MSSNHLCQRSVFLMTEAIIVVTDNILLIAL